MSSKNPKVLTLKDKVDILELLQKGFSVSGLARKYGVAKATVSSIKKKKREITNRVNNTLYGTGKRKTLRASELPRMEKSLYKWFLHMRNKKMPVSGLMLKAKALEIHDQIKENDRGFNASDGWLQKFKQRFGVRLLKISGEKLSAQPQLVDPFKEKLRAKMEELSLCEDQLYNADESGLYWKQLPDKTYVSSLEKSAPGAKMEKQRLTFMGCSNASGAHKLKLLVIGKSKNPRSFKNFTCPVNYKFSKSAWMSCTIFYDWFHQCFVKEVTEFLTKKGLPVKALLLIDNAPSHPPESQLISDDGSICAMFLPPNVTSLIQPMDQNVFKITKLYYRNSLLALMAGKQTELLDSIKMLTIKDAINLLDSAWSRISQQILNKCWKNILNLVSEQDDPDDNIPLSVLRERISPTEIRQLENSAVLLLQALNSQVCFIIGFSVFREFN